MLEIFQLTHAVIIGEYNEREGVRPFAITRILSTLFIRVMESKQIYGINFDMWNCMDVANVAIRMICND